MERLFVRADEELPGDERIAVKFVDVKAVGDEYLEKLEFLTNRLTNAVTELRDSVKSFSSREEFVEKLGDRIDESARMTENVLSSIGDTERNYTLLSEMSASNSETLGKISDTMDAIRARNENVSSNLRRLEERLGEAYAGSTEAFDDIKERIGTASVADSEAVRDVKNSVAMMRDKYEAASEVLFRLDEKIGEMSVGNIESVSRLAEKLSVVSARLGAMENISEKLGQLEINSAESFGRLEEKMGAAENIGGKIEAVGASLKESVEGSANRVSEELKNLDFGALKISLSELEKNVADATGAQANGLSEKLDSLAGKIGDIEKGIESGKNSGLQEKLDSIAEKISLLEERIGTFSGEKISEEFGSLKESVEKIDSLKEKVESLKDTSEKGRESLSEDLRATKESVEKIGSFDSLKEDVERGYGRVSESIQGLRESIDTGSLERRINALDASVRESVEKSSMDVKEQLSDFDEKLARIESIGGRIDALGDGLKESGKDESAREIEKMRDSLREFRESQEEVSGSVSGRFVSLEEKLSEIASSLQGMNRLDDIGKEIAEVRSAMREDGRLGNVVEKISSLERKADELKSGFESVPEKIEQLKQGIGSISGIGEKFAGVEEKIASLEGKTDSAIKNMEDISAAYGEASRDLSGRLDGASEKFSDGLSSISSKLDDIGGNESSEMISSLGDRIGQKLDAVNERISSFDSREVASAVDSLSKQVERKADDTARELSSVSSRMDEIESLVKKVSLEPVMDRIESVRDVNADSAESLARKIEGMEGKIAAMDDKLSKNSDMNIAAAQVLSEISENADNREAIERIGEKVNEAAIGNLGTVENMRTLLNSLDSKYGSVKKYHDTATRLAKNQKSLEKSVKDTNAYLANLNSLDFMLRLVAAKSALKKKLPKWARQKKTALEKMISDIEIELTDILIVNSIPREGASLTSLSKAAGRSNALVRKRVAKLVAEGRIEERKSGNRKVYYLKG